MNHIRKPVTLLLICCLLVGLSLTSSISATAQTTTAEQMELEEFDLEAEYGEIYVREDGVKEDVFSRKENAKLFEESDGTMTFEIYGERQHFLDDGKYVTIDNEVVEMQPAQRASLASSQSSGYRYMNKANDVHVLFSDAASLTDMVMVQREIIPSRCLLSPPPASLRPHPLPLPKQKQKVGCQSIRATIPQ